MPILGITASSIASSVASSYDSIATVNGTGTGLTLQFSSIPQTYKHLQIRGVLQNVSSGAFTLTATINGVTTASYATEYFYGQGSNLNQSYIFSNTSIYAPLIPGTGTSVNLMAPIIIDIYDYASTSKNKTVKILGGFQSSTLATGNNIWIGGGTLNSTSAVTSFELLMGGSNYFSSKSKVSLYGIK